MLGTDFTCFSMFPKGTEESVPVLGESNCGQRADLALTGSRQRCVHSAIIESPFDSCRGLATQLVSPQLWIQNEGTSRFPVGVSFQTKPIV